MKKQTPDEFLANEQETFSLKDTPLYDEELYKSQLGLTVEEFIQQQKQKYGTLLTNFDTIVLS